MIKYLLLSSLVVFALASCKKDKSTDPGKTGTPTILLSRITDNTTGHTAAEFTYNGKLLAQAKLYLDPDTITHTFNYSGNVLTGTTIKHTDFNNSNPGSSAITVSNGNINQVAYKDPYGSDSYKYNLIYSNDMLSDYQGNSNKITYTYNAAGNTINRLLYENGGGRIDSTQFTQFDNKKNFTNAMPYWIYYILSYDYLNSVSTSYDLPFLGLVPGVNNPLKGVLISKTGTYFPAETTNYTYTYQYNSYGYPSIINTAITYVDTKVTISYSYEYIQVK